MVRQTSYLQGEVHDTGWWFRIFGRGVRCVDHRKMRPLFSERNGYRKTLHVGPYCFALIGFGLRIETMGSGAEKLYEKR